jgi:hypothetical protein
VGVQLPLQRGEVGGPAGEGGAVDPEQAGGLGRVVAAEVGEESLVVAQAEELPDQLGGDDLAVSQGRGEPAGAGAAGGELLEQVVYQAEDGQDILRAGRSETLSGLLA